MHLGNLQKISTIWNHQEFEKLPSILPLPGTLKYFVERDKQRHLWLWSRMPNTGKTKFLEKLLGYGVLQYNTKEIYQNV
jgi:hypothetical protein